MHCSIVNLGYYMWCMMCCHECVCVDQQLSPFVWPTRKYLLLWNYMPKEKAKRLLISCHTFLWCHMTAAHEAKWDLACDSHWIPFHIMVHFGNFWGVYVIYMWTWAFVHAMWTWMCVEDLDLDYWKLYVNLDFWELYVLYLTCVNLDQVFMKF